jgi:DNA replication licensing factor MCM6
MVRLSEAIARANCTEEVRRLPPPFLLFPKLISFFSHQITVEFVNEAYNLLSQSIVHVEKDDVDIDDSDDEDDNNDDEGGDAAAAAPSPSVRDSATPAPAAPVQPAKPKISITYDRYMQIMTRVVYMISEHEAAEGAGMPRSEVVQQYLDSIENELGTIEQLEAETQLVEKVLNKLIKVRLLSFFPCSR